MNLGNHVNDWLMSRFGVEELSVSQPDIYRWFTTPLGQRIIEAEKVILDDVLPEMFGYHLMQLSVLDDINLTSQSPINHKFKLAIDENSKVQGVARFEQLPIEAESIDVALLHHVLEYSTNPHQLLREAARSVIANGFIVIVGFNPWSFLTGKKLIGQFITHKHHWRYHHLRRGRILDWLRVLDFEPAIIEYGGHGLPFNTLHHSRLETIGQKFFPITGAFYVIVARKSIIPMTMIKKPWKKTAPLPQWVKGNVASGKTSAAKTTRKIHQ